jgi:hypothetical protein
MSQPTEIKGKVLLRIYKNNQLVGMEDVWIVDGMIWGKTPLFHLGGELKLIERKGTNPVLEIR